MKQPHDERRSHVGTWLVGEGRAELARLLACRETLRYRSLEWIYRHHTAVYALGIGGFSALFIFLIVVFALVPGTSQAASSPAVRLGLLLLLLIPVSQLAIEVVNYLVTRLLPPRPLPKMDFEDTGIPDAFRTLVVVPMMLVNAETIRAEVEKLEIRYLANKEANLLFSLFTDYTDSATLTREDDSRLAPDRRGNAWKISTSAMAASVFSCSIGSAPGANPSRNSSAGNANGASWRN